MLNNGAGAQYPGGPGQPNAGAYIGLANNAQNIQSLQAGGYGMQGQMTANRYGHVVKDVLLCADDGAGPSSCLAVWLVRWGRCHRSWLV